MDMDKSNHQTVGGFQKKSFFYHSWERGKKMTLEYYPATSLARFFSDEGVGSVLLIVLLKERRSVSAVE